MDNNSDYTAPQQQPAPQSNQGPAATPPQPASAQPGTQPQQRNPLRIDDALLNELGLASLPAEDKKGLQKHIYETLEMRVGMRLADQMTNEQLDEFETYFNARDDAGAFRWLETNFPNYKDIVADEFAKLKVEVSQQAPQILAAVTTQPPAPYPEQPAEPGMNGGQQPPANQPPQQPGY